MRHNPTNPARSPNRPSDTGVETHRAGIRALDCGHDDREDDAPSSSSRAGEAQLERSAAREGTNSLGEQRQAL